MQDESDNEKCFEGHVEIHDQNLFPNKMVLKAIGEVVQSQQDTFDSEQSEESQ
jgi:hypothetical protein